MSKELVGKIVSIVLSALIALASLYGYHVVVVQPAVASLQQQAVTAVERCGEGF